MSAWGANPPRVTQQPPGATWGANPPRVTGQPISSAPQPLPGGGGQQGGPGNLQPGQDVHKYGNAPWMIADNGARLGYGQAQQFAGVTPQHAAPPHYGNNPLAGVLNSNPQPLPGGGITAAPQPLPGQGQTWNGAPVQANPPQQPWQGQPIQQQPQQPSPYPGVGGPGWWGNYPGGQASMGGSLFGGQGTFGGYGGQYMSPLAQQMQGMQPPQQMTY